jgi:hypothetical protein
MKPDEAKPAGFDAAVKRREDDHLNRWPLAREIYGITTTGPPDWSVRVGIYGEWGTGKTTVLEFIAGMAERDGHTLVRFNPWQCTTKDALWRGFVTAVYNQPIFYSMERAGWVRIKKKSRWFLDRGKLAEEGTRIFNDKAGKAVAAGLEIAKGWFSFSKDDLVALRNKLRDKRVIVLIDDLDRTAPELVPEILFALKELMDIPQFSFVCAFDPAVVGRVLRRYHPGFGDGLKFLEKIIDYPRWLPPPPPEGLANLAVANSKQFCPYVPELALRDAVTLLPPNPRAVRQFIRLLALLGPQIQRHNEEELRWSAILAANVIKIRQPQLAHYLLKDLEFWSRIECITVQPEDEEEELNKAITEQLDAILKRQNRILNSQERTELLAAMKSLGSKFAIWFGGGAEALGYQMYLAESPHAVTWKEFDLFIDAWHHDQTAKAAQAWMSHHSAKVERPQLEVYHEIFAAALQRYSEALRQADNVRAETEQTALVQRAESLIALLECLALELGHLDHPEKQVDVGQLEKLFQTFASFSDSNSPIHTHFQPRNDAFLLRFVQQWSPDVSPLVTALHAFDYFPDRYFQGKAAKALQKRLCSVVLPNFASQIINKLREPDFGTYLFREEAETHDIRRMVLDPDSPLWTQLRREALAVLREAATSHALQENAYELLHLFDYKLHDAQQAQEVQGIRKLISQKEILDGIWAAATTTRLTPNATARLSRFVENLKASGDTVQLPAWWDENIKALAVSSPPPPADPPGQQADAPNEPPQPPTV